MVTLYRSGSPTGYRRRGNLWLGLILAAIALISYYGSSEYNPVTNETQRVALTPNQEIALGLQAAPEMAAQHGGLHADSAAQGLVDTVGQNIIKSSAAAKTAWKFDFHLLADAKTINAFALPGGQIFITKALFDKLSTEGQLAGVLAHEIGHVVARHGAEHVAKQQLSQGLSGAAVVATGDYGAGQMAAMAGRLVNLRYGRNDELESDRLGVRFMSEAGYDPRVMITVMNILAQSSDGGRPPEFFSTHPNPENRIENIQAAIQERFPEGVPAGLKK
jgi:predicted Zn-dependent protease